MLSFEEYLTESKNTDVADVNEILLGYYLGGSSWKKYDDPSSVQKQLELKKKKITAAQYDQQDDRAQRMAKETISWSKKNGYNGIVKKLYWTARKGSLQRAVGKSGKVDSGNPTDILIEFTDGEFLGISAKSTLKNAEIGFKNPGMGTVEKKLKIELSDIKKESEAKFSEENDLPKAANARKKEIRARDGMKPKADKVGSEVMAKMRDIMIQRLVKMSDKEARTYIMSDWMDASDIVYPNYIKVTGKKGGVSIENPLENSKIESMNKGNIKFMKVGNESIGVTADNKKIMKMRFKYESQALASSMKLSGDPW